MRRRLATALAAILATMALTAATAAAEPAGPGGTTQGFTSLSVVPIYFVPANWNVGDQAIKDEAEALNRGMDEIRIWWEQQLGTTFVLDEVQLVQANGDRDAYGIHWNGRDIYRDGIEIQPDMWDRVHGELSSRGYPTGQSSISTPIFVKGAGGYAAGGDNPDDASGGKAILGDWAIDSISGKIGESVAGWAGRRRQLGAVAHELGHTFGLPHPRSENRLPDTHLVMGAWDNWPNVTFDEVEKARLTSGGNFGFFRPSGDLWVPVGSRPGSITGVQIQAVGAEVYTRIRYVNQDGTVAAAKYQNIGFNSSFTDLPAGFTGSVHISPRRSRNPLRVISNHVDNDRRGSLATSAAPPPARDVLLPLLMSGNGDLNTRVTVVNHGGTRVTGRLVYREGADQVGSDPIDLPGGGSVTLDQTGKPGLKPVMSGRIVLDATVDGVPSQVPGPMVAATVVETSPAALLEYSGFPASSAASTLAAPLVMADNFGAFTGIQVQNPGTADVPVTITYTGNTADPAARGARANCGSGRIGWVPAADSFTLQAGASATRIQRWSSGNPVLNQQEDRQFESCRYIGSATISAPGGNVVAIVNQAGIQGTPAASNASAYEAERTGLQRNEVAVPLLTGNNSDKPGNVSGLQVQNLANHEVTVQIEYGENVATYPWAGRTRCTFPTSPSQPNPKLPAFRQIDVAANSSLTVLIGPRKADNPEADEQFQGCTYVGSARVRTVTSAGRQGGPVSVLVNQVGTGGGDQLSTYVGE
jgi:hypothetical protein